MINDLKFGTSGLRGLVTDLTDEICAIYTQSFLTHLLDSTAISQPTKLLVGMDLRQSSLRIANAVMRAATEQGFSIINAGTLPTPALALAAQIQHLPAIMVTGSHIPEDRNGLKFYRPDGEITKQDEQGILASLQPMSKISNSIKIPAINPNILDAYHKRCLSILPPNSLKNMHIGVYQHSSVARDLLVDILENLGAKISPIARADHFIPVDTEALRDEDRDLAFATVKEYKLDALVSTDGDADRPLLAGSDGIFIKGDILGILTAHFLNAHAVATPVTSSSLVETSQFFEKIYRCRVGSPYVIEAMEQATLDGFKTIVGFEANGGVLLGSNVDTDNGTLEKLATRDALLPILSVLGLARSQSVKVEQLTINLPHRFTASNRLSNIDTKKATFALNCLEDETTRIHFFKLIGLIEHWDVIDGLRIIFKNGDTLHFRLSGNAPEMRCYSEADTQMQADKLMQWGLKTIAKKMEASS